MPQRAACPPPAWISLADTLSGGCHAHSLLAEEKMFWGVAMVSRLPPDNPFRTARERWQVGLACPFVPGAVRWPVRSSLSRGQVPPPGLSSATGSFAFLGAGLSDR